MGAAVDGGGLVLRNVDYLGTHAAATKELTGIDVAFGNDAVTFSRRQERLGSVSWADVKELSAFSESTPARVSFPAVLLVGLWAFLFKQGGRRVILRVADREGAWLFEVPGIEVGELSEGLAGIRAHHNVQSG